MNIIETTQRFDGYVDDERVAYAYKALMEPSQPYIVNVYIDDQAFSFEIPADGPYNEEASVTAREAVAALTNLIDKARQWDAVSEPIGYTLVDEPQVARNADEFLTFPVGTRFCPPKSFFIDDENIGDWYYVRTEKGYSFCHIDHPAEESGLGGEVDGIIDEAWPLTVIPDSQSDYVLDADIHIGPLNDACKGFTWAYDGIEGWTFQYEWEPILGEWLGRHKTPAKDAWSGWKYVEDGPQVTDTCVFYKVT